MSAFFLTMTFCAIALVARQSKPVAKLNYDHLEIEVQVDNTQQAAELFFDAAKQFKQERERRYR